jgi:hypothetical protein
MARPNDDAFTVHAFRERLRGRVAENKNRIPPSQNAVGHSSDRRKVFIPGGPHNLSQLLPPLGCCLSTKTKAQTDIRFPQSYQFAVQAVRFGGQCTSIHGSRVDTIYPRVQKDYSTNEYSKSKQKL